MKAKQITIAQFGKLLPYLPLYVAQRRGFFKKEGLQVNIINAHGDEKTWDMVTNGDAQFGVADPLLMVEKQDVKGVIIAGLVQRSPNYGIAKNNTYSMESMKDFAQKTIAVFKSPSTSFALIQRICSECEVAKIDKPKVKEIDPRSLLGSLNDPDVDVVLLVEPSATIAELDGGYRVFIGPKYFKERILFSGIFSTADYVHRNPEITQGLVSAIENSLKMIHDRHLEAVKVAREEFPEFTNVIAVEMATLRLIADNIFPTHATIEEMDWDRLMHIRCCDMSMHFFGDYVDNNFAINARKRSSSAMGLLMESTEVKPRIPFTGISIDIKNILRNWFKY